MCITVEQAKSLAVSYHAFAAADVNDHRKTWVWGRMLLEDQRATGVEMYENWWLEMVIERADKELHAKAA